MKNTPQPWLSIEVYDEITYIRTQAGFAWSVINNIQHCQFEKPLKGWYDRILFWKYILRSSFPVNRGLIIVKIISFGKWNCQKLSILPHLKDMSLSKALPTDKCLYVVYHLPVRMHNNILHWILPLTNCKGNIKLERLLNHLLERKNQYGTSTKGIKNSCQRCELNVRCGCGCGWEKGRGSHASSSPGKIITESPTSYLLWSQELHIF